MLFHTNWRLHSSPQAIKLSRMYNIKFNRREFMRRSAVGSLALPTLADSVLSASTKSKIEKRKAELQSLPPVRAITQGPKFHWFSYYDKLQFDPTGRYALGMEVDFEHRSPKADDVIKIGMVDLENGDKWAELSQSSAWCWQQGCMLQWRPGSKDEIIWNDRQDDRFVCHILNVHSGSKRTLPYPIYTVNPDGRTAVAPDFRRVQDMRPGYGYAGLPDPHKDDAAPDDSGIPR